MIKKMILVLAAALLAGLASAQVNNTYNLMPVPLELTTNGQRLPITGSFRVAVTGHPGPRVYAEASRFVRRLGEQTGLFLDRQGYVEAAPPGAEGVTVEPGAATRAVAPGSALPGAALQTAATLLIKVNRPGKLRLGEDESYTLETGGGQAVITAETDLGAIHGLETVLQLVSADENGYYLPGVSIRDTPRFAWRGLLLDVALHFMPVDEVKRTLDGMAAVKMNVLHLHLCNDQGFRVESKVFPRLTQVASDGLFYTQEDIREIIRYAGQRGIRVVPEFVVPAHTTAILTAFPELASVKRDYHLQRYFGVFDPVLDPTNEKVYVFLGKLYTEMAALFPDDYFHIGGDENTGKDWENTPHICAFMKAHGFKTYMDLQTYFNRRILVLLKARGKTLVGWDEVLQPGVPKDIVIQSWRGKDAFYASVKQGYRAILSNGYYIDLIQPTDYHYLNDPIPDSVHLSAQEQANILGGEATMWSEMVTPETVDSRIWPRTAAIAERLWSPAGVKDVDDMYRRLDIVSLHLEALGLRHELYKQAMLRRLAGGWDTRALGVLVDVLEPLKIYERNQGDTMYTVFSPFTKIADAATPDQRVPRIFNREVDSFLTTQTPVLFKNIMDKLTLWQGNNAGFLITLKNSPELAEAAGLSASLSALAGSGISAMRFIGSGHKADPGWVEQQASVIEAGRQEGGRCTLEVVDGIEKLIERAGRGE